LPACGPLVLTHLAVTLFVLLFAWTLADLWQNPTRGPILRFGLVFAGALLAKFSAGLLFAVLPLFFAWSLVRPVGTTSWPVKVRTYACLLGLLLGAAVVYLTYLTLTWGQPANSLWGLRRVAGSAFLTRLFAPVAAYGEGVLRVLETASRPAYLFGRTYPHGIVRYFPTLFLLKMTPGFLGQLAAVGVLWAIYRKKPRAQPETPVVAHHRRALVTTFVVFTAACLSSQLNIGIRHFYVPIILLMLSLACVPGLLDQLRRATRRAVLPLVAALALASVGSCLLAYPNYVPYLNFLASSWPKYVVCGDSNLDWDQATPAVEDFAQRHHVSELDLETLGVYDPHPYVPGARSWNCESPPAPGESWAVLSASAILEFNNCAWLLAYPHEFLAGGSLLAVHFPTHLPAPGKRAAPPEGQ
jgi:hypothetical protein